MPDYELRLDRDAVRNLVEGPQGPVVRMLYRDGVTVMNVSKTLVGVDTGELRADIHLRPGLDSRGPFIDVGSDKGHARVHHDGGRPHVIVPRNAKVLRFKIGGRFVFARRVFHPGTTGTHYLTRALEAIRR